MGKKKNQATQDQAPPEKEATGRGSRPDEPVDPLRELEAKCEDLNARWLRAQADYQNLRRRAQEDLESNLQRHMQPLLVDLLLVLDFLDLALASPAESTETKNLVMGVEMTRTKFVQVLEASDVDEIDTTGEFDPTRHEATDTRTVDGAEPGTIVETVRKGYTWRGRVLRPARVVVAASSDDRDAPSDEPNERAETS